MQTPKKSLLILVTALIYSLHISAQDDDTAKVYPYDGSDPLSKAKFTFEEQLIFSKCNVMENGNTNKDYTFNAVDTKAEDILYLFSKNYKLSKKSVSIYNIKSGFGLSLRQGMVNENTTGKSYNYYQQLLQFPVSVGTRLPLLWN